MLVKATRLGYYENKRRREGEVFPLKAEIDFSARWMKKVSSEEDAERDAKIESELKAAKDKAKKLQDEKNVANVESGSDEAQVIEEADAVEPEAELSETELMKLNKDVLIEKAEELGLDVDESLTKAGIVNLILSKDGGE